MTRVVTVLATAGMGLMFLEAAATVEVGYTLTPAYALFAAACGIGLPLVVQGWMRAPLGLRVAAALLLLLYLLSLLVGDTRAIGNLARAGAHRDEAYFVDMALGIALIGLCIEVGARAGGSRKLVLAAGAGALVATVYALYQWVAQQYDLPLADVNNAINTTGLTFGESGSQGTGLLGWERIRGTFVEPQYLAAYLASTIFLAGAFAARWGPRAAVAAIATVVAALVLTSSAPGMGTVAFGALASATALFVARGVPRNAALAGAGLAATAVAAALVLAYPTTVAGVTGRSGSDLVRTTEFRVESWSKASDEWARRPVLGWGPGQTSVRLAAPAVSLAARRFEDPPLVLGSAHGLWAAALVDAGVFGLAAWLALLGGLLAWGLRALLDSRSLFMAAVFASGVIAIAGALIAGDRLEIRIWAVLALLAASACGLAGQHTRRTDQQAG